MQQDFPEEPLFCYDDLESEPLITFDPLSPAEKQVIFERMKIMGIPQEAFLYEDERWPEGIVARIDYQPIFVYLYIRKTSFIDSHPNF